MDNVQKHNICTKFRAWLSIFVSPTAPFYISYYSHSIVLKH
jgi:hypothetical protein